jgi:hypothetical protein
MERLEENIMAKKLEKNIMAKKRAKLEVVGDNAIDQQPIQVPKPDQKPSLDKFKSKSAATIGGVETLLTGLPHHTISEARDFVRLHDDEDRYWSPELCFVNVPVIGQKRDTLHLIAEDIRRSSRTAAARRGGSPNRPTFEGR